MKPNKNKIYSEIKRLGMTPTEFYKSIGWSKQRWWYVLNTKIYTDKINPVAHALGVPAKELLE